MRSTRPESPLWQRLLLAVTVAFAVVGMHHLTSLGCSEPVSHHGVASIVESGAVSDAPEEVPASDSTLDDIPPGLTCLALLIAVGVVFRAIGGVIARKRDLVELRHQARVNPRIVDPPDLHVLSISRT